MGRGKKLTDKDIEFIKELHSYGLSNVRIAEITGRGKSIVSLAINDKIEKNRAYSKKRREEKEIKAAVVNGEEYLKSKGLTINREESGKENDVFAYFNIKCETLYRQLDALITIEKSNNKYMKAILENLGVDMDE